MPLNRVVHEIFCTHVAVNAINWPTGRSHVFIYISHDGCGYVKLGVDEEKKVFTRV